PSVDHIDHREQRFDFELQNQLAAGAHGLDGIDHQVQHALLDELRVDRRGQWLSRALEANLHALRRGLRGEEVDQLFQQRIQLNRFPLELDSAGVAQEVVEDLAKTT